MILILNLSEIIPTLAGLCVISGTMLAMLKWLKSWLTQPKTSLKKSNKN